MISKEKLEELIKQGAKVWCICDYTYDESKPNKKIEYYDLSNEDICISPAEFRDYGLRVFDALGYWNDIRFECLFETLEEAEWHKEFGSIERTERLKLPTWEEIQKYERFDFKDKNCNKYTIHFISGFKTLAITGIISVEFYEEATKKNYIKACRKAKELFLGE